MIEKKFYTYELVDPFTYKVFYIGKGSGRRAFVHTIRARNTASLVNRENKYLHNKIVSILKTGKEPIVNIYPSKDEESSYCKEIRMIKFANQVGIKLCNMNEGGEGGHNPSEESRRKMSEASKRAWSIPSIKKKRSEAKLKYYKLHPEVGMKCTAAAHIANIGRKLTSEHRKKISAIHKGKIITDKERNKIRRTLRKYFMNNPDAAKKTTKIAIESNKKKVIRLCDSKIYNSIKDAVQENGSYIRNHLYCKKTPQEFKFV